MTRTMPRPKIPEAVGLCPGDHTQEFYCDFTLAELATAQTCPMCEEEMIIYRTVELTRIEARAIRLALIFGVPIPMPPEIVSAKAKLATVERLRSTPPPVDTAESVQADG